MDSEDAAALGIPPELTQKIRQYLRASRAESTLRGYRTRMRIFDGWCALHNRASLPASTETVALFLVDLAGRCRPKTVDSYISGIAFAHRASGYAFDRNSFNMVIQGIRRVHGTAGRQVAPITLSDLRQVDAAIPDSLQGARNRALMTLGFAGAFRCSELVSLDVGQPASDCRGIVEITAEGLRITLLRSKTDQHGAGIRKVIPRGGLPCPVAAMEHWLSKSGIRGGPIFRRMTKWENVLPRRLASNTVAGIVKRVVHDAALFRGLSKEQAVLRASVISSHSMRVGFVTSAVAARIPSEHIAQHVGWTSTQMTARYVRQYPSFTTSPALQVLSLPSDEPTSRIG